MNDERKLDEFDMDKAAAELRAAAPVQRSGRKLSHSGQCAAFAALRNGAKYHAVAAVFDISETSVSNLAGCIDDDREPLEDLDGGLHDFNLTRGRSPERSRRYRHVAALFNHIGELEFKRRYYTPDIHERILAVQALPKSKPHRFKPNPHADQSKGLHDFGEKLWILVEWLPNPKDPSNAGWAWIESECNGFTGTNRWKGRELDAPGSKFTPYRTSTEALDGAKKVWEAY
jgi:hypothetical protein